MPLLLRLLRLLPLLPLLPPSRGRGRHSHRHSHGRFLAQCLQLHAVASSVDACTRMEARTQHEARMAPESLDDASMLKGRKHHRRATRHPTLQQRTLQRTPRCAPTPP